MKKILRIVITGGPCGGKTTALEEISKIFRVQGYTVFTVNETATELINDGVKPFGNEKDLLAIKDFQQAVLDAQLYKEGIREFAAKCCGNDKVVILYDRGILDNRAYLKDEEFKEMIDKKGITEAQIISRYDLVIHLVTAAAGKEEFYTTDNNTARTETVEEARERDKKTMETWSTHPNQVIIGNDCLFDEKIKRVGNTIRGYLGENEVIDQRKYKIEINQLDLVELANKQEVHMLKEEIEEFVISNNGIEDEMYRKSTIAQASYYTYTKIKYNNDGTKTTVHKNVTEELYLDYKSKIEGEPIKKVRYNFIFNNERYRLDFYCSPTHLITLERDVTDKTNTKLPPFVTKIEEITNDRDYSDATIYSFTNKVRKEIKANSLSKKLKMDLY